MAPDENNPLETKVAKLELALFGENGRGGIVKDISDIKSDMKIIKSWTGFSKPLFVAIITGVVFFLLTHIPV